VYDADSLALVPEHVAVGLAAATWCNDGECPEAAPDRESLQRYFDFYARARGRPFTAEERRGATAAAVWNLAYIARCEHALDPDEQRLPAIRQWLRVQADRLLSS
jgi:hypothetical protein